MNYPVIPLIIINEKSSSPLKSKRTEYLLAAKSNRYRLPLHLGLSTSSREMGSRQQLQLCKCSTSALEYEEKLHLTLNLRLNRNFHKLYITKQSVMSEDVLTQSNQDVPVEKIKLALSYATVST